MNGKIEVDCTNIGKFVTACYSMPRLGFTDNLFGAVALGRIGIPIIKSHGVFWHQGLTGAIEQAIENGAKYVVTIDYDTIFRPEDVMGLYALMETNRHADAICAVQMRREEVSVLFGMRGPDGQPLREVAANDFRQGDLSRVHTAHFGLTMLRLDSLRDLPKPWFHAIPGKDGRWAEGHVDADCAFWHRFESFGRALFQANRVVVGHLQLMISFPDQNLRVLHQTIGDYEDGGKPEGVWR